MEIKRDYYLNQLIERKGNGLIKIISGIRRCGKSHLLDPIFKNYLLDNGVGESHIIKVDLDSLDNESLLNAEELNRYLQNKMIDDDCYYILLDEIQKVDRFVPLLNGLLKKNVDIYVTGSNSKLLSSDIVTEFRGRGDEIRVYPLSFYEFLSVYNGSTEEAWSEYIVYGGLPLVVLSRSENLKMQYLMNQKNSTYIRDVIERHRVQNEEEFESLIEVVSSSVGSLTNPLKLSHTYKNRDKNSSMSDKTIYNYLNYMQDAFLIEKSKRYDVKGKKYIDTPYKFYFTDPGIRNAFLDFRQIEETHLMENIIYIELRRRGYQVDVGIVEIRDKNSRKQIEIDFICNYGSKKYYIQSALSLDNDEKFKQEERPLISVQDFFKKIIITKGGPKVSRNEHGVLILNLFEFLCNVDSLDL